MRDYATSVDRLRDFVARHKRLKPAEMHACRFPDPDDGRRCLGRLADEILRKYSS